MKKLLKSFLITTASIGTIAGSTAAVVSCGEAAAPEPKDSQKEYDDALKSLLSKLTNTPIVMDIAHNQSLDNVKSQIQTIIKNDYIANDASLSSALGDAEVLVPQNAFDLTNINTNVLQATGITFQVEPKVAGLTKGAAEGLNIGYKVINNDQDNYNQEVVRIKNALAAKVAADSIYYHDESVNATIVKNHILSMINSVIGTTNLLVNQLADANEIPDSAANQTAINDIVTQTATVVDSATAQIAGIVFQPKSSKAIAGPANTYLYRYKVATSAQDTYNTQLAALLGKFTTSGQTVIHIVHNSTAAEATAQIKKALADEKTTSPSSYSLLDLTNITFSGTAITDNTFDATTSDSSVVNTLTSGLEIRVAALAPVGHTITTQANGFQFYYNIGASETDKSSFASALGDIASHFSTESGTPVVGTNLINFDINEGTGDSWQDGATGAKAIIQKAIYDYVQTQTYKDLLNLGTNGDNITVKISGNNFMNTWSGPTKHTGTKIYIVPTFTGSQGIPAPAAGTVFTFWSKIEAPQTVVRSAADKIKAYLGDAGTIIDFKRLGLETSGGPAVSIDTSIANKINTFITSGTGTNALTDNEKAAINTTVVAADIGGTSGISNASFVTNSTTISTLTLTIHKSTLADSTVTDEDLTAVAINYTVSPNADDSVAQGVLRTAVQSVIAESTKAFYPVVLTITKGDAPGDIEAAIKKLISDKLTGTTGASTWLKTTIADITVTGVTASTIDTSVLSTGTLAAGVTVTATVVDAKNATTVITPIALTGLAYEVSGESKQEIWEGQARRIIVNIQSDETRTPLTLTTGESIDSIKDKIVSAVNTEIRDNSAPAQKTFLADAITATNVNAAASNFDVSTPTTTGTRTSTTSPKAVEITIPASSEVTGVTPVAKTITLTYSVHTTTQDDYTSALNAIKSHFSGATGVDLFTATVTEMDTPATIQGLIQTSIFAYITHASGDGYLTAAQKAALTPAAATDITVEINGTLPNTPGANVTNSTNNISVTIPTTDGATAQKTLLSLAKYNISEPLQSDYDNALNAIFNYFTSSAAPTLFTAITTEMGDGGNDASTGVKAPVIASIQKSIYDYISTYSGTGALTSAQKAALGDLGYNGANITVAIKGHLPHAAGVDQTTDATNDITIHVPPYTTLTATDKDLTGAKYTITVPADPVAQKEYSDAVADISTLYDRSATETYQNRWDFSFANSDIGHVTGMTLDTTYNKTQFSGIMTSNWFTWIQKNNALHFDPIREKRDALVTGINTYTTNGIIGVLTISLVQDSVTLSHGASFDVIFSFAPVKPGVSVQTFTKHIVVK